MAFRNHSFVSQEKNSRSASISLSESPDMTKNENSGSYVDHSKPRLTKLEWVRLRGTYESTNEKLITKNHGFTKFSKIRPCQNVSNTNHDSICMLLSSIYFADNMLFLSPRSILLENLLFLHNSRQFLNRQYEKVYVFQSENHARFC